MKLALIALLLVTPVMMVPHASAWSACSSADDPNVIYKQGNFYVRRTVAPLQVAVQVWQDTNGIPGLQIDHCIDENGDLTVKDTVIVDTGSLPPPCVLAQNCL